MVPNDVDFSNVWETIRMRMMLISGRPREMMTGRKAFSTPSRCAGSGGVG